MMVVPLGIIERGEATPMPFYLVEGTYTRDALKRLVSNPQSRLQPVIDMLAKVGGKLHHQFFVLGECDMIALYEVPDDVDAAAVSLIVSTSGHMASFKTRRLLTDDEGLQAMRKAHGVTVAQPS